MKRYRSIRYVRGNRPQWMDDVPDCRPDAPIRGLPGQAASFGMPAGELPAIKTL